MEILAHPQENGIFKKGIDVIDSKTGWTLPAKCVPEEAVDRKGVGLLLVPGDIENNGKVVIHPEKVVILAPFLQESHEGGKVDEATRMPLAIPKVLISQLPETDIRWLFRMEGIAVRPIVRFRDGYQGAVEVFRQDIDSIHPPDYEFGVAGEGTTKQLRAAVTSLRQLKK